MVNPAEVEASVETSVDSDVVSLQEQMAALTAKMSELQKTQAEERESQLNEKRGEVTNAIRDDILEVLDEDIWEMIASAAATGIMVTRGPSENEGEPPVTSFQLVAATSTKPKASGGGTTNESRRDLDGILATYGTPAEKAEIAGMTQEGKSKGVIWQRKSKIATDHGFPPK